MYKCLECGEVFEDPKKYCDDLTPGGAFEGGSFLNYYSACPYCAGNYEEVEECFQCGELTICEYIDGKLLCDNCAKKIEENEDM